MNEKLMKENQDFIVPDWAVKSCFNELEKPKQDKRKSMERE